MEYSFSILITTTYQATTQAQTASSNTDYGIGLTSSSNNSFSSNTASGNTIWDFYSDSNSVNNTVTNLTINPTISFTGKDVAIKSVSSPLVDDPGYQNISHYVNATNNSADSWLYLNVSYSDLDVSSVDENSLRMFKYSSGIWTVIPPPNGVNAAENYVFSNITAFSVFAPMASLEAPNIIITLPKNITYLYSNVSLTFSADDTNGIDWSGYSLDAGPTITSGNTTITDLSDGAHNVTALANNTLGNMNQSTQHFSVNRCIEDSNPGDTCILPPGNYSNVTITTENLTVKCAVEGACYIFDEGEGIGVKINADKVTWTGFTIGNWTKGITLAGDNITVANNTLIDNHVGIQACECAYSIIEGNNISSSHSIGIALIESTTQFVSQNNVSNLDKGILLKNTDTSIITQNTANQCNYGYVVTGKSGSFFNTLSQNEGLLSTIWDYYPNRYSKWNTFSSNTYCTLKVRSDNSYQTNILGGICP
jgi:parallel beta-helix repeat protein